MKIFTRLALYLWRDRGGYDPATGGMSEDYNLSLLSRFRHWRYSKRGWLGRIAPWLAPAVIGAVVALAIAAIPFYLNPAKPDQQVNSNSGELFLRCAQEADNILRCRPVGGRNDQVVARSKANSLKDDRPLKK